LKRKPQEGIKVQKVINLKYLNKGSLVRNA
jgi:hypothetical protein